MVAPMTAAAEPADTRWLSSDEQAVWRAFLDVSRLMTDQMNRQLSDESGMSLPEYEILVALSEAPGRRLRMSELADRVVSSRSRITHTVGRMEQRGLVHREACLDDGRGVLCALTDGGFAVLEAAAPGHVEDVRAAMFDPLTTADVEALGSALGKIRDGFRRRS
ncbi:MAG: MarR family winged helix-turn-helix transcriptional regulator [Kineosporiaceae bacterium]